MPQVRKVLKDRLGLRALQALRVQLVQTALRAQPDLRVRPVISDSLVQPVPQDPKVIKDLLALRGLLDHRDRLALMEQLALQVRKVPLGLRDP